MLPRAHAGPLLGVSAGISPPMPHQPFWRNPEGPDHWQVETHYGLVVPPGLSVNDGIDPDLCSLTYTSVHRVAEVVVTYLPGALLAKIDVESAYRLVPVHPLDCPLQAM